ncbi:MAG TPA: hypothetical protein VIO94_11640, partial [Phenylobacterium sp.]
GVAPGFSAGLRWKILVMIELKRLKALSFGEVVHGRCICARRAVRNDRWSSRCYRSLAPNI